MPPSAPVLGRAAALAALAILGAAGLTPPRVAPAVRPAIAVTVSARPVGRPLPPGFVGLSVEYRALAAYTGAGSVFAHLLAALAPGASPVLRVGGDSTDGTWWPAPGLAPAPGTHMIQGGPYALTPRWLGAARALATATRARLILGINLAAGRPALAAAEARALVAGIGRRGVEALEIGNEPDLYPVFGTRPRGYDLRAYVRQFTAWRRAVPAVPLAGPATAGTGWLARLGTFLAAARGRLGLVTAHRYPLSACDRVPSDPGHPTIPHLLAPRAASGPAQALVPFVRLAHARGLPFRVGEMNSASCEGTAGVSDTFASALWAVDGLFHLAAAGVDGVNIHTLPGAHYELFTVSGSGAIVHPEYDGLLLFTRAFPAGARLLPTAGAGRAVTVWATRGVDGRVRVTLINRSAHVAPRVRVIVPGARGPAALQALRAPGLAATSGVTLGERSFGAPTRTGTLPGPPRVTMVAGGRGGYTLVVPSASVALLSVG